MGEKRAMKRGERERERERERESDYFIKGRGRILNKKLF